MMKTIAIVLALSTFATIGCHNVESPSETSTSIQLCNSSVLADRVFENDEYTVEFFSDKAASLLFKGDDIKYLLEVEADMSCFVKLQANDFGWTKTFVASPDYKTLTGWEENEDKLVLKKAAPQTFFLEGAIFSRDVQGKGEMGSPIGSFKHSLKFISATEVIDNGSSFFGNPPATYSYEIQGSVLTVRINAETEEDYQIAADGKTLTLGQMVLTRQ